MNHAVRTICKYVCTYNFLYLKVGARCNLQHVRFRGTGKTQKKQLLKLPFPSGNFSTFLARHRILLKKSELQKKCLTRVNFLFLRDRWQNGGSLLQKCGKTIFSMCTNSYNFVYVAKRCCSPFLGEESQSSRTMVRPSSDSSWIVPGVGR